MLDCNNFFVSCERVFRPELKGKAVIVLSNNDGCAIARSNEAKEMGIKMGTPFFQLKHLVDEGKLVAISCNHRLYGDMSRRVMGVVKKHVPKMEVYSVDECFMDLEGIEQVKEFGERLAKIVEQWTGIPVSVGVASSKVLAKIASRFAKRYSAYTGCCAIVTEEQRQRALQLTKIEEVWGVGRKWTERLTRMGIVKAAQLANQAGSWVEREMNSTGMKLWRELNGVACIDLRLEQQRKSLTCSRSFKEHVTERERLEPIVADFAVTLANRLRRDKGRAEELTLFLQTNVHRKDLPQYAPMKTMRWTTPTNDMREVTALAKKALKDIYKEGYAYKKAGIVLTKISYGVREQSLFDKVDRRKQELLLSTLDRIRANMGDNVIGVGGQEPKNGYVNSELRSPCYTSVLEDVIRVKDVGRKTGREKRK